MRIYLVNFLLLINLFSIAQQNCNPDYGAPVIRLPVDSLQIVYTDIGKGPVLLFIHGLGENAGYWRQNLEPLSRKGFRCIAIDLPGSGYSSRPALDTSINRIHFFASVINRVATLMELKKVTLIGNDLGGQVAIIAAAKKPVWLKQLVLVAPTGLETFTAEEIGLLQIFNTNRYYRNQDSIAIDKNIRHQFLQMPVSAAVLINQRLQLRSCTDFDSWISNRIADVSTVLIYPVMPQVKLLQVPVLFITADKDSIVPNQLLHSEQSLQSLIDKAKSGLKKSTVKTIANAGHLLHWEQPVAFNEAIVAFAKGKN